MKAMRWLAVSALAVTLVGLTAWPAGSTYTGFTVDPPSATVGSALTITAALTGGTGTCDAIGLRVFLLPPASEGDTPLTENGTGVSGSTQVLLDITPVSIPTPGTYRVRLVCGGEEVGTLDFPVTEAAPPTEPPAEPVAATPAFTG